MSIKFKCGNCKQKLEADDIDAGEYTECPMCGSEIMIPEPPPPMARAVSNLTLLFRPSQFQDPMEAKVVQPPSVAQAKPLEPETSPAPAQETPETPPIEPEPDYAVEIPEEEPDKQEPEVSHKEDTISRKEILQKRSLGLGPAASSKGHAGGDTQQKGHLRKFSLQINSKSAAGSQDQEAVPDISQPGLQEASTPAVDQPVSAQAPSINQPVPGRQEEPLAASSAFEFSAPQVQQPQKTQTGSPAPEQEAFEPIAPEQPAAAQTPQIRQPSPSELAAQSEVTQVMRRPEPKKPPHPVPHSMASQPLPSASSIAAKSEVTQVMKRPEPKKPPHPKSGKVTQSAPSKATAKPTAAAKQTTPAASKQGKKTKKSAKKKTFGKCPKCKAEIQVKDAAICIECGHKIKPKTPNKFMLKLVAAFKLALLILIAISALVTSVFVWISLATVLKTEMTWFAIVIGATTGGGILLLFNKKSMKVGLLAVGLALCSWVVCKGFIGIKMNGDGNQDLVEGIERKNITDSCLEKYVILDKARKLEISPDLLEAYKNEEKGIAPPERFKNELADLKKNIAANLSTISPQARLELAKRLLANMKQSRNKNYFSLWDILWLPLALGIAYLLGSGTFKKSKRTFVKAK